MFDPKSNFYSSSDEIAKRLISTRMLYIARGIIISLLVYVVLFLIALNILSFINVNSVVVKRLFFAWSAILAAWTVIFLVFSLAWFNGKRLIRLIKPYNANLYSHILSIYELGDSTTSFSRELYLEYAERIRQEVSAFDFKKYIFSPQVRFVISLLFLLLFIVSLLFAGRYGAIKSAFTMHASQHKEGPGIIVDLGKVRKEFFFPSYTGMKDIVQYDDSRTIEALKGTILRITVTNVVDSKEAYVIYQNTKIRMDKKGNHFVADVSLVQNGYLRVDFIKSGIRYSSSDFKITILADESPEIFLSGPEDILRGGVEARPDRKIELSYTTSDDYGVKKVSIVVSLPDGKERAFGINDIVPPKKEFSSEYVWDYSDIAKYMQGELMFALESEDNDTLSGPKRQRTRFYKIALPKSGENFIKDISLLKSIRSAMLRLLSLDITYDDLPQYISNRKDIGVEKEIIRGLKEYKGGIKEKGPINNEIEKIIADLSLYNSRFNSIVKKYYGQMDSGFKNILTSFIADETTILEKNILILQDLIDEVIYATLSILAKEISGLKKELRSLVERYEQSRDEELRIQIMAVISLLKERLKEYSEIQSELATSFSDININKRAVENLSKGVGDIIKSIDDIEEGFKKDDVEAFKKGLLSLEAMTSEIENDFSNMLSSLDQDKYRELVEDLTKMSDDIKDLMDEQRKVSSELSSIEVEIKRRYYDTIKEILNNILRGIIEDSLRLKEDISSKSHIIKKGSQQMNEYSTAVEVQTIISNMIDFLKERQIFDSLLMANSMVVKLQWINDMAIMFSSDGEYQKMITGFYKRGVDIRDRIKSIIESAKSSPSANEQQMLHKIVKKEQEISKSISELSRKAKELSAQFGDAFEKLGRSIEEASRGSASSVSAMKNNNVPLARSNVDDSISRLDDALKEISRLKNRRAKMLSYSDNGGDSRGRRRFSTAEVKLPPKEDFKPDQTVREEIMKAINEEEIRGYEDFIRKYYEEIIR